jgi:hypothetical protein
MSLDYVEPSAPPPVDWVGPVFPEPLLYSGAALWFILLIAALVGLIILRQRLMEERAIRRRAPELIFAAVRKTIDQALMKTGAETIAGGRRVAEALDLHLGPLIAFSDALNGRLGKLKKALDGKADDHAPHGKGEAHGAAQSALVVTAGTDQHVTIAPAKIVSDGHAPHGCGDHKGHDMTAREQINAVRQALEHLSEYWCKGRVEDDLRKIQDALMIKSISCQPSPRPVRLAAPASPAKPSPRRAGGSAPRNDAPKVF